MTVWAEGVFLLNASLDYLLLAGAVRLRGGRPGKRLIGAALLGGAASVLALFPPFRGFGVSAAGFFLLVLCAYGLSLDGLRCGAVFLALSLALCGIQTALAPLTGGLIRTAEGIFLRVTWPMLAASAALLYGFAASVSGAVTGKKPRLIPVQITAAGKTVRFRTLLDTGSFLRDPLTGRPVVLADSTVAGTLLQLEQQDLRDPCGAALLLSRLHPEVKPRMIPYKAVGVEQGMLLGIRCEAMSVGSEQRAGGILAFMPGTVSEDGSYHGLTGG